MVRFATLVTAFSSVTLIACAILKRQSLTQIQETCQEPIKSLFAQCGYTVGSGSGQSSSVKTCLCTSQFETQLISVYDTSITCIYNGLASKYGTPRVDPSPSIDQFNQVFPKAFDSYCNGNGTLSIPMVGSGIVTVSSAAATSTSTASSGAGGGAGVTTPVVTPTATYTQTFPTSSIASNAKNVSVGVTDPRITFNGADWQTNPSSTCNSGPVKTNNVTGESLTFTFTGTAVYMATAENSGSGVYSVAVDGQAPVAVDGFQSSKTSTCSYAWSAFGLSASSHTVVVQLVGPSSKAAADGAAAGTGFELDGFTITTTATTSSGAISRVSVQLVLVMIAILTTTFVI